MMKARVCQSITSVPVPNLESLTKETLLEYFFNTWELTEILFTSIIEPAAMDDNPDPLRNPLIFYLGHPATFYINTLRKAGLLSDAIDVCFETAFSTGVDPEIPEELPKYTDWPQPQAVQRYRHAVFNTIVDLIERVEINLPIRDTDPLWALMMAIEHDRIHFETSSVLIRQYPLHVVARPAGWNYAPMAGAADAELHKMLEVGTTDITIGKSRHFPTFGWDNEYGRLDVHVPAFRAGKNLVTNGQFLEFLLAGGYSRDDLWTAQGRAWKSRCNVTGPKFWALQRDGQYAYRAMFDLLPLPQDWPAEVVFHEAVAYCNWKGGGRRPLTEKEFLAITRDFDPPQDDVMYDDRFNINLKFGSPAPVGMFGKTHNGFNDIYGNVWNWLSDSFYPLPGFQEHYLYPDFSSPYYDDNHVMMRGASWSTTGTGASQYYRLWFRPHFYQHAGFRIAADL